MDNTYFINYNSEKIYYTLIRSKRKTIGISVSKKEGVKVSAPQYASGQYIKQVIEEKAGWIFKKLYEIKDSQDKGNERVFNEGLRLLFLGNEYILKIVIIPGSKQSTVMLGDESLTVFIPNQIKDENRLGAVKDALIGWYRENADKIVKQRISHFSKRLNVFPNRVVVKTQKARWGSCSSKKNININWKLVMAPLEVIDYVVVHELSHLKVMNHSKKFWDVVEAILPEYKNHRKWLKSNGWRMTF